MHVVYIHVYFWCFLNYIWSLSLQKNLLFGARVRLNTIQFLEITIIIFFCASYARSDHTSLIHLEISVKFSGTGQIRFGKWSSFSIFFHFTAVFTKNSTTVSSNKILTDTEENVSAQLFLSAIHQLSGQRFISWKRQEIMWHLATLQRKVHSK